MPPEIYRLPRRRPGAASGTTPPSPADGAAPVESDAEASPAPRAPAGISVGVEGEHTVLAGARAGDRSVRIIRPRLSGVHVAAPGYITVENESQPDGGLGLALRRMKRTLIGRPIRSENEHHERLSKTMGLAAFGTDNISSSAYATEELMRVLMMAGTAALFLTMPLTVAVVVLLAVVVTSYQQTIKAYPKGGGSYIVSSDNLGVIPGLVAGSSILVDYVLTVSVSVSAGVAALTSIFPAIYAERVLIAVVAVAVIAWANLRGVRESGMLFVVPVYAYVVCMLVVIAYGLFRFVAGPTPVYIPPPDEGAGLAHAAEGVHALGLLLVLRAFASGSVGLTGTEAIADGVAAFKAPESKNARVTLVTMATCFATLFLGISFLSSWLHIVPDPSEVETVNSQLVRTLFGNGAFHFIVQVVTAVLLVLAANTAFADFPRLASFMARDKFLPSYFGFRGDRLAFNNGILVLALVAAILIVIFQGSVTNLIPLYTVGVFIAFTLSQAGLVVRWWRQRGPGWRLRLAVNAIGAATTLVVAIVVGVTKFALGAWVVLVLIPALVFLLLGIRRHYRQVADELVITGDEAQTIPELDAARLHHTVLIPVGDVNRAILRAVAYARSLTGQVELAPGDRSKIIGVHVTDDREAGERLKERWARSGIGIPLVVLQSPYRSLLGPLVTYIDALTRQRPDGTAIVTVLLPEFLPAHWWEHLLHMQTALRLKGSLLFRPGTVVTSVPYHLSGRSGHPKDDHEALAPDGVVPPPPPRPQPVHS
jgi:amino acid transporter